MIPLLRPHAGRHIAPKAPVPAVTSPAAGTGEQELTVGALQPPAYAPFDETEAAGTWPGAGGRIETALLADPEGGTE